MPGCSAHRGGHADATWRHLDRFCILPTTKHTTLSKHVVRPTSCKRLPRYTQHSDDDEAGYQVWASGYGHDIELSSRGATRQVVEDNSKRRPIVRTRDCLVNCRFSFVPDFRQSLTTLTLDMLARSKEIHLEQLSLEACLPIVSRSSPKVHHRGPMATAAQKTVVSIRDLVPRLLSHRLRPLLMPMRGIPTQRKCLQLTAVCSL